MIKPADNSAIGLLPKLGGFTRDGLASLDAEATTAQGTAGENAVMSRQRDFSEIMSIARRRVGDGKNQSPEAQARDAAERFVAVTLIQPILDQARENNDAAPPFKPTRAEQQFRSMIDAQTAMNIARSSRLPIVDRLARDLLRSQSTAIAEPLSSQTITETTA